MNIEGKFDRVDDYAVIRYEIIKAAKGKNYIFVCHDPKRVSDYELCHKIIKTARQLYSAGINPRFVTAGKEESKNG